MVNITEKTSTLRVAIATAVVRVSKSETIRAIEERTVPKGDVFEMSKAAGLLAVKKTPDLLPDCHPLPIEYTAVSYRIEGLEIHVEMEVRTIYKTGVEVEAMHGVSVVALNMYDMLKPLDKGIEIGTIKLVRKKGGKSDFKDKFLTKKGLKAGVVVCSDTISAGQKEDKAGKVIVQKLEQYGVEVVNYQVIPDEKSAIEEQLNQSIENGYNILIYTGGTGLSVRDVTPDTLAPLLDRRIPGIEETIRRYGQERMPYAMLSRSIVGEKDGTLVMALPGSTNGARESMDAVFPEVLHVFGVLKGGGHFSTSSK
jgi:molybdenum cofactor biosynthesis protein MoaC